MKSDDKNLSPMQRKNELESYDNSIFDAIRGLLIDARTSVYKAVNFAMVQTYWEIGKQIGEAVENRSEYGKGLLQFVCEKLTAESCNGISVRNLRFFSQFFRHFKFATHCVPN
ncbi:MAG: DUF1016 domain-containing protein [Candidatus Hydrogenedens sp.]|nr:DUF1016 domain-containing protein [Candidatus Hydrogenedens sp.]